MRDFLFQFSSDIGDAVAPVCVLSWIPPVLAASISFKFIEATVVIFISLFVLLIFVFCNNFFNVFVWVP